ncbi:hypothetical protein [Campylobacter sp. RM12651]|uniref:hypothetical protein n=1 Tax=Campylobacter sp. RM12651 TaxID=1660079 RepID=UPI001EFAA04C|nr:hypothetical protein [Campylobacter sp. RM12651]ULO03842.1 hypothetical protein AVBRAN_1388 [Campylobacter sp. RM12651]
MKTINIALSIVLINSFLYANNQYDILKNIAKSNPNISELVKSANKELSDFNKNGILNFDTNAINNSNAEIFGGQIKDKNNKLTRTSNGLYNSKEKKEFITISLFSNNQGLSINIKTANKNLNFSEIKAVCSNKSKIESKNNYLEQYSNNTILQLAKNYKIKNVEIDDYLKSVIANKCSNYNRYLKKCSGDGEHTERVCLNSYFEHLNKCVINECNNISSYTKSIVRLKDKYSIYKPEPYYLSCYENKKVYDTLDIDFDNLGNIKTSQTYNYNATGCICTSSECNSNYNLEQVKNFIKDSVIASISSKIIVSDIKDNNNSFSIFSISNNMNNNNYQVNKYNINSSSKNTDINNAIANEITQSEDYKDFALTTTKLEYDNNEEEQVSKILNTSNNEEIIKTTKIVDNKVNFFNLGIKNEVQIHTEKIIEPQKCLVSYEQSNKQVIQDENNKTQAVKNLNSDSTILKTKACKYEDNKHICELEPNEKLITDCNSNIDSVSLAKIYATNEVFSQIKNSNNKNISDNIRIFKGDKFFITEKQIDKCPAKSVKDVKTHSQGWAQIFFGVPSPYDGKLISLLDETRYLALVTSMTALPPQCLLDTIFEDFFGKLNFLVSKETAKSIKYDKGLDMYQQRICCNIQFKKQDIEFPEVLEFKNSDESKAFCDAKTSYIKSKYNSTCADYIHNARATQRIMNVAGSGCNITYAYDGEKVFKKDKSAHIEAIDAGSALAYKLSGLSGFAGIANPQTGLSRCKQDLNNNQSGFVSRVSDGACKYINHEREVIYYNSTPKLYGYNLRFSGFKIKKDKKYSYISYPSYTKHTYNFCCQKSKISKIIMEEAEKQAKTNKDLGAIDFCEGLTLQQFKLLDFNKMNFDELASDFGIKASANLEKIDFDELKNKANNIKDNTHIDISNIDSFKGNK